MDNHTAVPKSEQHFSFDGFVVGPSNRFAYEVAIEFAKTHTFEHNNPVLIYGPNGVGKTHLLYAIRDAMGAENHIFYITVGQFIQDLLDTIHTGTYSAFPEKYLDAKVLLVDDIQFLSEKKATQDTFCRLYDLLFSQGCQLIITADCHPNKLVGIEKRLLDRLCGDLIIYIDKPDLKMRTELVKYKAAQKGLLLSHELIHFIAQNAVGGCRQIDGALLLLQAADCLRPGIKAEELLTEHFGKIHR